MITREELQDEILQVNVPEDRSGRGQRQSAQSQYPSFLSRVRFLINTTHELGPHVDSQIGQRSWGAHYKRPRVSMNFLGPPAHPIAPKP